jgi:predicted DNA-binding transcriptional regulator YafY
MRNAEVIRQWKILKRIEAGRYTTSADLAAEHGVTERTIRRDIEALQEAGSALYFGKNMISILEGAPFAQELESAFVKIQEALPVKSLPYLQRIQELFLARPDPRKDYSQKQDAIASVIDAILHQRQARIAYFSFNSKKTKTYTLDPYRLVYFRGGLYLYARAHEYGEVRTFAVERIEKIEVLDLNFKSQEAFDASEYVRGAFGIAGGKPEPVEMVFDQSQSGYIRERVWHESQQLEEKADGSTVLKMNVYPSPELKSWIKGFLPHVRVLQPARLRDEIAKDIARAGKTFAAKGAGRGAAKAKRSR